MARKRFSAEQIVTLLRQIEVAMGGGKSAQIACREAGISEQSFYRWRKEYGGLDLDQARRMKDLEKENARGASSVLADCNSGHPVVLGAHRLRNLFGLLKRCRRVKLSKRFRTRILRRLVERSPDRLAFTGCYGVVEVVEMVAELLLCPPLEAAIAIPAATTPSPTIIKAVLSLY